MSALPASAASTGSCPTASALFDGAGTEADPYRISSPEDLQLLWEASTDPTRAWSRTVHYLLENDIDMTSSGSTCTWDQGIGYEASDLSGFQGSFNGGGHVISDLDIVVANESGDAYAGLFYFVNTTATVSDLVYSGSVSASASDTAVVGALAAYNSGTITGAGSYGTVSGQTSAASDSIYSGGLVGSNDGDISSSFSQANVEAVASESSNAFAGGLVGIHNGNTVASSAASGSVTATATSGIALAGGIAGAISSATLEDSYTVSSVSAVSGGSAPKGGIAGSSTSAAGSPASFWNAANATDAFGDPAGPAGLASAKTLSELATLSTYTDASWDIYDGYSNTAVWNWCPAFNDGLPFQHRFAPANPCMSLTPSTQTLTGTVNNAVNPTAAFTANYFSGPVTYTVSPALPAGLSLDSSNGTISGTPTATYSTTTHTVTAANGSETATSTVSVTVGSSAIAPSTQTLTGSINTAIAPTAAFTASGFSSSPTYTVSPELPTGLSLDPSDGVISGTPTATHPATTHTVTASNGSETATAAISVTVAGASLAPSTQTLSGYKSVAVTPTAALTASGFASTPTYTISPDLPNGLNINSTTGVISGTPTVAHPTTTHTITATHNSDTATATVAVSVSTQSLSPATQTLTGTTGVAVTATSAMAATGFSSTPTYTISPALPDGLSFNAATGVISGTPTAAHATATHTITGKVGSAEEAAATVSVTVTAPTIAPAAQTVTAYRAEPLVPTPAYTASGFPAAPTYAVSPQLPFGLSLSTTTGVISGTPTMTQQATTYTVTATNGAVTATATVSISVAEPTAPSSPLGVTVVAGNGQAVVSWQTPQTDGGSAIIAYEVLATPGGKTCTAAPPTLTCTITGLENGVSHTATVRAQNVAGWSAASSPSASFTPVSTEWTAPSKVRAAAGNGKVTVRWAAASAPGLQTVTGYRVTAEPGGRECVSETKKACTVKGLTNGVSYTFTVVASSTESFSPASAPSAAVTPKTVPGKVRNLKAASAGKGALRISWTPPASNGGARVTRYEYRINSRPWAKSAVTVAVVKGLISKKPVRVSVRALNAAGNGPQVSIRARPR